MRFRAVMRKLEAEHPEGVTAGEMFLSNTDLLPVSEEKKTWNHMSFVSFWIADAFNLNTFTIASSMITAGMTWWQAFICVIVGYTIVGPLLVLNARPGAIHGITFPAVNRTTYGIFGSLWPVFNRAAIACIWWGVQAWLGGECVYVLLRSIWPSFARIHNTMPASSETTTAYIVAFIIYWLLSLTVTWVPIHKLRWWFAVKAVVGPIVGFTLFGWSITRAGGIGPVFEQKGSLSGSDLRWAMLTAISSCTSNMFGLVTNAPDFASRAKTPSAAVWPQLLALPISFTVTSFLGIVISSTSIPQFGHQIWDVVKIMDTMLDVNPTSATRAGMVFISAGFIYVQLMLNVAANSISAGCDLTALLPRFINIRRGGYICCLIGILMNPWLLYKSSATFGTYLGSYGVLLSCIAGPMITDYWLVRRGHVRLRDLYTTEKGGWYHYTFGINWRGYAAYLAGFAVNAPGFIHSINPNIEVGVAAQRIYTLSWVTGTGVSSLVYFLCCFFSPPPGMNRHFEEIDESDFRDELDDRRSAPVPSTNEEQTDEKDFDKESQTRIHVVGAA